MLNWKAPGVQKAPKLVCEKFGQRSSVRYTRDNFKTVVEDPKSREEIISVANFGRDHILSEGPK